MARACLPLLRSLTGGHCSDTPAVLNDFAQQLPCAAAIMFLYIVLRSHKYPAGGLTQILFPDWSVTESHTETFRLCLSPAHLGIIQNFPRGFNLPEAQTESYSTGVQLTVTQSLPIANTKSHSSEEYDLSKLYAASVRLLIQFMKTFSLSLSCATAFIPKHGTALLVPMLKELFFYCSSISFLSIH